MHILIYVMILMMRMMMMMIVKLEKIAVDGFSNHRFSHLKNTVMLMSTDVLHLLSLCKTSQCWH